MARSFVLGIDCDLYMQPASSRKTTPPPEGDAYNPGTQSSLFSLLETVTDVTLNLTSATADLTTRKSGGWRQMASTLKEGSVDFTVLWEPDDLDFSDLLDAFLNQCPRAFQVLDGPNTGMSTAVDAGNRCGESGVVTGLYGDFAVTSFSRNEALEEGVTADVTIELGQGIIVPYWLEIPTFTP